MLGGVGSFFGDPRMCSAASTVVKRKVTLQTSVSCHHRLGKVGYIPEERPEDDSGNTAAPVGAMAADPPQITPVSGHSHERREPEQHGEELDTSDSELMGCGGEAGRGEEQVCDGKNGPDGREEHEVNARRRPTDSSIHDCNMISMYTWIFYLRITYGMLSDQER